jgi:uncharacterized protein (UPF0332 family)
MDPLTFYAHAAALAEQGSPAECRSAVSRVYYAAFHAAVAFLGQLGVEAVRNAAAHAATFNALLNGRDPDVVVAGSGLLALHSQRTDADYRWADPATENQETARAVVRQAHAVILALQNCLRDPARRDPVRDAIRNWVTRTPGCNLRLLGP